MVRTQIMLSPYLQELLKSTSQSEGKSISSIVREALEYFLIKKKKTGGEILLEMAKHASKNSKIPTDLSTNDDYLYKLK